MHLITLTADMQREDGQAVKAGEYLVDDLNAAEMLVAAKRGTAEVHKFTNAHRWHLEDQALPGAPLKTLVIHPGGFGDQMMLGPALRAHKRQYPDVEVHLCCRDRQRTVFYDLGYPDKFVDYPLNLEDVRTGGYQKIILTENSNEGTGDGRTMHAIDLKAKLLEVDLEGDRRTELSLNEEDIRCAWLRYPPMLYKGAIETVRRPRVGVQLAASAYNRTPSAELMRVVLASLYHEEWEIIIFGSPGSTQGIFDQLTGKVRELVLARVHDAAEARLTFRESAAAATTCDVLLVPDSAMLHVAGALKIPCVALFGPIPYQIRTEYYPSVFAIQGKESCPIAPCFFHQRGGIFFPHDGPCHSSRRCNALDSIKTSEIGRRLNQMRKTPPSLPAETPPL
jgi:hypothetical protein